jgi:hypothetical protein
VRPQSLKSEAPTARLQFFCSFFRQGAPKSKVKKSYRGQKISKFAVIKLFNTKGLLKIPCK